VAASALAGTIRPTDTTAPARLVFVKFMPLLLVARDG